MSVLEVWPHPDPDDREKSGAAGCAVIVYFVVLPVLVWALIEWIS